MNHNSTTVPVEQTEKQPRTAASESEPFNELARAFGEEFGKTAGKQVGNALAEEIHNDPAVRRATAQGVGIGIGVAVGLGVLALFDN